MIKSNMAKLSILGLLLIFFAIELAACGAKDSAAPAANTSNAAAPANDAAASAKDAKASGPVEVNVEASNFKWDLDKTEFAVGQPIHFNVTSKQGTHGFSIVNTDVKIAQFGEGDKKDVTWTPDKAGEYTIKCVFMCGSGHSTMTVKINVK
jgi:cytochrome c oxidase subunit II